MRLGVDGLDANTLDQLWEHKARGGFEDVLAALQNRYVERSTTDALQRLEAMQNAILQMFHDMDKAFANVEFERQEYREYQISRFLTQFDAIFTLNQDTLLERHYWCRTGLDSEGRWAGHQMPGMRPSAGHVSLPHDVGTWSPLEQSEFRLAKKLQPFIKLHGSSNWVSEGGEPLLIIGGNKAREIEQHPILSWNFERFQECLLQPETRLMVIGYSFRDEHVNRIICDASTRNDFHLFIIDPLGVDVLNENRTPSGLITADSPRYRQLQPRLIGASRRSLGETFGNDRAEFAKVMRFFA